MILQTYKMDVILDLVFIILEAYYNLYLQTKNVDRLILIFTHIFQTNYYGFTNFLLPQKGN